MGGQGGALQHCRGRLAPGSPLLQYTAQQLLQRLAVGFNSRQRWGVVGEGPCPRGGHAEHIPPLQLLVVLVPTGGCGQGSGPHLQLIAQLAGCAWGQQAVQGGAPAVPAAVCPQQRHSHVPQGAVDIPPAQGVQVTTHPSAQGGGRLVLEDALRDLALRQGRLWPGLERVHQAPPCRPWQRPLAQGRCHMHRLKKQRGDVYDCHILRNCSFAQWARVSSCGRV